MTDAPRKDIAASIRDRMQNHARATGQDFQRVLVGYGIERLLYRLARSLRPEKRHAIRDLSGCAVPRDGRRRLPQLWRPRR